MKILFIGDINGKIGRRAVASVLSQLRRDRQIDLVIANVENIAHGKGLTDKTLQEVLAAGVDVGTSGNHVFDKPEGRELLADPALPLVRPANFPLDAPGQGWRLVPVGQLQVAVVNLIGRVFIKEADLYANPFATLDDLLPRIAEQQPAAIIVDFHAEATSEKVAMGWHADGRVAAVLGTHTHVPTADVRVLPRGTAFATDVGMTGLRDGIIGVGREAIVEGFRLGNERRPADIPEHGMAVLQSVLVTVDSSTGRATAVERLDMEIEV